MRLAAFVRVAALAVVGLVVSATLWAGQAEDFADGKALGNARKADVVTNIRNGTAKATDPNFNDNAPQKALYGNSNLSTATAVQNALCASKPSDPSCAAAAVGTAQRPKQYMSNADPALSAAKVTDDPSVILGNIASTYSACASDTMLLSPATFATTTCALNVNAWSSNTCTKTLDVVTSQKFNCTEGTWMASGKAIRYGPDTMYAEALCEPNRKDGKTHFRVRAEGAKGACNGWQEFDVDMTHVTPTSDVMPTPVAVVMPHWGGACHNVSVYAVGTGCQQGKCQQSLQFFDAGGYQPKYTCPAGQLTGDRVLAPNCYTNAMDNYVCDAPTPQNPALCYAAATAPGDPPPPDFVWAQGDGLWSFWKPVGGATANGYTMVNGAGHWDIAMNFAQPQVSQVEGDYWTNTCEPFEAKTVRAALPADGVNPTVPVVLPVVSSSASEQCVRTNSTCTDGPSTRVIDGVSVTRTCWAYSNTFDCTTINTASPGTGGGGGTGTTPAPTPAPTPPGVPRPAPPRKGIVLDNTAAAASGFASSSLTATTTPAAATATSGGSCTDPALGACTQVGAVTCVQADAQGRCLNATANFSCKQSEAVYGPALNCGSTSFCPGGTCYDKASPPDPDFAQAVTMLEASREVGQYLDPATLKVFKGFANGCDKNLWGLNSCCKGTGTNAAAMFNNLSVATDAISATGRAAFSNYTYDALFTSDAPNFVINGFESLFGTGMDSALVGVLAGDLSVEAFLVEMIPGPWSIAMLIIQYSGMLDCPQEQQVTAMKRDAGLCHSLGEYCSKRAPFGALNVGKCMTMTENYCCFPSRLAKIVNEQGKGQLGLNWGTAQAPDCGGFTMDQLQSLDFSAMDLSEFYAEIVPTLPNLSTLQSNGLGKKTSCYYGAGKC